MLKVRVFGVKDFFIKILIQISTIFILYFVFCISLKLINANSRTFAANVVEENIGDDLEYAKGELNLRILNNELGIGDNFIKRKDEFLSSEDNTIVTNNDKDVKEIEKFEIQAKYVEAGIIKTWDRPKYYSVNRFIFWKSTSRKCMY